MKQVKTLLFILFIISAAILWPTPTHAAEKVSDQTAQLASFGDILVDNRVNHLRAFLASYDSPLSNEAITFVREADRNDLDWRFVAAIAGVESTFGKHVPGGSFNAWGWGIPTGAQYGIAFTSWSHGIAEISEGLRQNYVNRGADTIEKIGRIYAASPAWSWKVRFFIQKIDEFTPADPAYFDVTL